MSLRRRKAQPSQETRDQTLEAVMAFINASTWKERRRIVETRHKELLSDAIDPAFMALLMKYRGNTDKIRDLQDHYALLIRCRREGIDSAFASPERPADMPDTFFDQMVKQMDSNEEKMREVQAIHSKWGEPQERDREVRTILGAIQRTWQQQLEVDREIREQIGTVQDLVSAMESGGRRPPSGPIPDKLDALLRELKRRLGPQDMPHRVAVARAALKLVDREAEAALWAKLQFELAYSLSENPKSDRAENLEQAIVHYEQALEVYTRKSLPEEWAQTLNNLAAVYGQRIREGRAKNIEQTIDYLEQLLEVRTRKDFPKKWALIQHNLGTAYLYRVVGDRPENLEQAIKCFRQALEEWTRKASAEAWAKAHNNLGIAYTLRILGERGQNIEEAIEDYKDALKVYDLARVGFPKPWAETQLNLGNAYNKRVHGDKAKNIEQAIKHYQQAHKVCTREAFAEHWADIHNNLGDTYRIRIRGNKAENIEKAIEHFTSSLEIFTCEAFPEKWAIIQYNLGLAFEDPVFGNKAENIERALECYQEALRFWTPEGEPYRCRLVSRNLASRHFAHGDWHFALGAYRAAMDAGERLYRAGLSAESKAVEMAENVALYCNAAFAAARLGDVSEALPILERGKTRLLAEALRLRVPRPANVPAQVWTAFERAGAAVPAVQSGRTAGSGEGLDPVQAYTARERAAREASVALDAAVEGVREYAPDFLKDLDLSIVLALLPDERTALVAFCITDQGSMGFVVSQNRAEALQMVDLPGFTIKGLRTLIMGREGWIRGYWSGDTTRWRSTMERVLAEVGEKLLAPILAALPSGTEKLVLLPSGGLFLLPLHAVPVSSDSPHRVCDRYQVSYAPSVGVLADCQTKGTRASGNDLYAVINPEEDPCLVFTPPAGAAIAGLFAQREVHEGRAGTKDAVVRGVRGRAYLHFSCHGAYNWNDPPESGLALADGRLTLAELQSGAVDMSAARLVTLSACETGLTDVLKGSAEEYVGLPAGFMLAGVPCVVSSLWAVPDLSTALLMERFYGNHLEGGMNFAAALHEAQSWVREVGIGEVAEYAEKCYKKSERGDKGKLLTYMMHYRYLAEKNPVLQPFAHPYYWAAFTVNGM